MTEQPLLPPPDELPEPVANTPKQPKRDLVPWLFGLGFLVLAAAVFYLWQYPGSSGEVAGDASAIQAVDQRLTEIDARLTRLEQRPAPDLGQLTTRVDALDRRIGDQAQLASRSDVLSGRIEALSGRNQSDFDAIKRQVDSVTRQVSDMKSNAPDLGTITKRLQRIAKLQAASLALASGYPIGELPNAPEVLAQYAHSAPPTEAQLRLRFPQDERAALAGEQPNETDTPFIGRVWDRAQGLITIRRGDEVVVGNSSAIILSSAQSALEVGDMAGAVTAVESLKGQPAQVMARWLADAKALLAARSALAEMAGQA